jgi:phage repressor protein C with HTH and peptisase S24 domain
MVAIMGTGKEIRRLRLNSRLSAEKAAKLIGVDADRLRKWEAKDLEPRKDDADSIEKFFGVSIDKLPELKAFNFFQNVPNQANEPFVNYLEQRRDLKSNDDPFLVPFVDVPAQAGYTKAYQQRDYIASLKKYPILPDVDPTGAIWRYFQIEGHSMEPTFLPGDVILCSQVPREDWSDFKNFYTYVVVTDDNLWIKDVYRESEREWILLSQNAEPFSVKVEEVKQLWVMRRHVKARAQKHNMYNMEEVRKKIKGK